VVGECSQSEAAVERAFRAQSFIFDELGAWAAEGLIEAEMMICINFTKVFQPADHARDARKQRRSGRRSASRPRRGTRLLEEDAQVRRSPVRCVHCHDLFFSPFCNHILIPLRANALLVRTECVSRQDECKKKYTSLTASLPVDMCASN